MSHKHLLRGTQVVHQYGAHVFEDRLAIKHGIRERHTTPASGRLGLVVDHDPVALSEQAVRHGRSDVADAPHKDEQPGQRAIVSRGSAWRPR